MTKSLRRDLRREVPVVLDFEPGVTFVLAVPGATAWSQVMSREAGAGFEPEVVSRFVLRLEGHPEAAEFGAPDTPERRAFVEAMNVAVINALAARILDLATLTGDERKNLNAPSVSPTTTDGATDAVVSAPV